MKGLGRRARARALKLVLLTLTASSVLALPLSGSNAATPGAGTVSDANRSVTWTGAVTLATAGACSGANDPSCDNYKLTIEPPSYGFQVKIELQPVGDWDLYVYGPNGGLAGSSGNGPNQLEVVTLTNPAAGTYTVAAAPFAPLVGPDGNSYTASATLTSTDTTLPGANGNEPITYANYPAPSSMGGDAGEPSIGADWKSGKTMFQAGLSALQVTWDDSVSPGNASWKDVSFPTSSTASLDPIGFMDQTTSRWFSSQLSGTTSLAAITDDDGANWIPSEGGPLNGGVDHQTIGGGPYHAPLTGTVYPHAFYYCSQDLVAALCARSDDGGLTFSPAVPIYTDQCGGLHGHVKVAPDGTVYVPNRSCGGKQGVAVSEDNGLTWTIRTVPGSTNGAWDPSVGVGSDGTVYFGYDDGDGHPKVAVSHDHGQTWTNIHDVGTPFSIANSAFPAVVAGDGDRAAFAFLGTSYAGTGAMGDDPNWPGVWHLYVSTTYDGGNTWTTVDATPNDPVQKGTICGGGFNGCPNGTRNLLDFIDASVDKQGRVQVAIADGCIDACVAGGPNTFSALATIARQVNGRGLFAAYDQNTVPAAPNLSGKAVAGSPPSNLLTWQQPNDGGSPITTYRIYRKTGSSSYSLLATVGAGSTSYSDTQLTAGQTYTYKVSAVNANGEGPASNEVTPAAPPPPQDPCQLPGVRLLTDASGDSTTGTPGTDLKSLYLSQSIAPDGSVKLRFQLNTDPGVDPQPAGSYWYVSFKEPDGKVHGVRMWYDPTAPTAPTFQSYIAAPNTSGGVDGRFVQSGSQKPADASSSYDAAAGTIVIAVSAADLGLKSGDQITGFNSASVQSVSSPTGGGAAATVDEMPNGLTYTGSFGVGGCSVQQPDLAISGTDITLSGLKGQGNDQVVVAVVHNLGTATASNVAVKFAVDGVQVGTLQTIGSIAAGGTGRASVVWNTQGQNGTHTIAVTADPANAITESNESNNTGLRTVTVKGSKVG
jgi:CARDB/Fibronectin type III domain/BNR repeat-like domain